MVMAPNGNGRHRAASSGEVIGECAARWLRGEELMTTAERIEFFSAVARSGNETAAAAARRMLAELLAEVDTGTKQ